MRELFGLLLLVGIIAAYFWWIVAIVAVVGGVWLGLRYLDYLAQKRAEVAAAERALVERADRQHNWAQQGDPRGTFGEGYVPLP